MPLERVFNIQILKYQVVVSDKMHGIISVLWLCVHDIFLEHILICKFKFHFPFNFEMLSADIFVNNTEFCEYLQKGKVAKNMLINETEKFPRKQCFVWNIASSLNLTFFIWMSWVQWTVCG